MNGVLCYIFHLNIGNLPFLNVIALLEQGLDQASKATPLKVQKTVVTKPPTALPCMPCS